MVLLLGATGFLGQNVLRLLLERHIPVRTLVRSSLSVPGVDVVKGNILEEKDLLRAAEGCSAIINCAGTTDMRLRHLEDFYPVNRDLPRLLTGVLDKSGIAVLVHVSTANTIASGSAEHPSDESVPIGPPFDRSLYALSKLEGEKVLLEYASGHPGKRIVILNPGFMIGAYDFKPSSGELLLTGWKKPLMLLPRGGKSFLHVRDAAVAIVNALERGEGRYLLTGEYLSLKDFYALQAHVMAYSQKQIVIPNFFLTAAGLLGNLLGKLGIKVIFYLHNTRQLLIEEWYSCSRAREELDFPQTPVEEAIKDFFTWRSSVK